MNPTLHRASISTGTVWEGLAGYARAVRIENRILVSGTTATGSEGVVGAGDPEAQTRFILDKIEAAIQQLGGTIRDVVRTRIYVTEIRRDWQARLASRMSERSGLLAMSRRKPAAGRSSNRAGSRTVALMR